MSDSLFTGGFESWTDVRKEFSSAWDKEDESIPIPDEVILADYEQCGYEGSAHIVYRLGGKFYVVEASHCSCYGLEGQWDPTEYESAEELAGLLEKRWDQSSWGPAVRRLRSNNANVNEQAT